MAGIDKIYGTKAQYDEFKSWCEQNCPQALPYFYKWNETRHHLNEYPITNLPGWIDKWLLKNCHLPWVVARLKTQYGLDHGARRYQPFRQDSHRLAQRAARRPQKGR